MKRQHLTPTTTRSAAMAAAADLLTMAQEQLDEGSFSGHTGQGAAVLRAIPLTERALRLLRQAEAAR